MATCPKCGSANIHADKKGFSAKKGIAGAILFGRYGLLAGAVGSNKIRLTCLDCGYQFKPGEGAAETPSYTPANNYDLSETVAAPKRAKGSPEQKVKIETLLKYRSVIKESKVTLLEDLKSEGKTHVIVPGGEIEALSKLQANNSEIKRIVSFRICE
ncbi:hypothetical protein D1647_02540 [Alistipes sp. Z76]|jgi:hypothetical protein|uniref:hypothetical protein n=1 Tax=uncultured Muribaculum sp. TaxID=1918613 RepID=UPI000EA0F5A8|nr:hypothetical protein [uncultured Muribaculum sp.]NBJ05066.1 hypothetical protein [Alistipes sp. Z76]NCE67089.1 hypothetical protein [Muribaculaceae bacterium M3]